MPFITTAAILLLKKVGLKAGMSLSAKVLQQLSNDPQFIGALNGFAQNMGISAGNDVRDFLLDNVGTVGELMEKVSDFL